MVLIHLSSLSSRKKTSIFCCNILFHGPSNWQSWCRNPPLWGTMKYLCEKIPKDTSSKVRINRDLYSYERIMETAPTLPDFALALKPDEYQLPQVDPSWRTENVKGGQSGATNHLNG